MAAPNPGVGPTEWDMKTHFEKAATTYEKFGGALTRKISKHLIAISEPPLSASSIILDNATGPGITCTEILAALPADQYPQELHATDFSEAMIKQVDAKGHAEIKTAVMDAQDMKFPDEKFTHIYMAFIIFGLPKAEKAASELYRLLQPGGSAYVTTWAKLGWSIPVNKAIHAVRPDAEVYEGPVTKEWRGSEKLKDTLVAGGFEKDKVEVHRFNAETTPVMWDGSLDFIKSGVMNMVIGSWSEEEKEKFWKVLEEVWEESKGDPVNMEMPAWVGVARK